MPRKMTQSQIRAQQRIDSLDRLIDDLREDYHRLCRHSQAWARLSTRIIDLQHEREHMVSIVENGPLSFS